MPAVSKTIFSSLALAAAFTTTLMLAGCGGDRAETAATGLTDTRTATSAIRGDVSKVVGDLLHLKDGADPRATFAKLTADTATVKSGAEQVKSAYAAMKEQKQAYLDAWKKEISTVEDPALKASAAKRVSQVEINFIDITNAFGDAKASYEPFVTTLDSLQAVLSNDQTAAGIAAAEPTITKGIAQGTEVQVKLAAISAQLDELSGQLVPAPAPAK